MPSKNYVEFNDLVEFGKSLGYENAYRALFDDDIYPKYELRQIDFEKEEIEDDDYDWCDATRDILRQYFEKNNLQVITVIG